MKHCGGEPSRAVAYAYNQEYTTIVFMMHSAFAVYIVEIMCDGVHVYNIYIYMYDIMLKFVVFTSKEWIMHMHHKELSTCWEHDTKVASCGRLRTDVPIVSMTEVYSRLTSLV